MSDHHHPAPEEIFVDWAPPQPRIKQWIAHFELYEDGTVDAAKGGNVPAPRPRPFAPRIATIIIDTGPEHCQMRVIKYNRITGEVIFDQVN